MDCIFLQWNIAELLHSFTFLFVSLCQFNAGSKIIRLWTLQSQQFIECMSEILHVEFTKPITMETIISSRNNHDRLSEKKLHSFVEEELCYCKSGLNLITVEAYKMNFSFHLHIVKTKAVNEILTYTWDPSICSDSSGLNRFTPLLQRCFWFSCTHTVVLGRCNIYRKIKIFHPFSSSTCWRSTSSCALHCAMCKGNVIISPASWQKSGVQSNTTHSEL